MNSIFGFKNFCVDAFPYCLIPCREGKGAWLGSSPFSCFGVCQDKELQ